MGIEKLNKFVQDKQRDIEQLNTLAPFYVKNIKQAAENYIKEKNDESNEKVKILKGILELTKIGEIVRFIEQHRETLKAHKSAFGYGKNKCEILFLDPVDLILNNVTRINHEILTKEEKIKVEFDKLKDSTKEILGNNILDAVERSEKQFNKNKEFFNDESNYKNLLLEEEIENIKILIDKGMKIVRRMSMIHEQAEKVFSKMTLDNFNESVKKINKYEEDIKLQNKELKLIVLNIEISKNLVKEREKIKKEKEQILKSEKEFIDLLAFNDKKYRELNNSSEYALLKNFINDFIQLDFPIKKLDNLKNYYKDVVSICDCIAQIESKIPEYLYYDNNRYYPENATAEELNQGKELKVELELSMNNLKLNSGLKSQLKNRLKGNLKNKSISADKSMSKLLESANKIKKSFDKSIAKVKSLHQQIQVDKEEKLVIAKKQRREKIEICREFFIHAINLSSKIKDKNFAINVINNLKDEDIEDLIVNMGKKFSTRLMSKGHRLLGFIGAGIDPFKIPIKLSQLGVTGRNKETYFSVNLDQLAKAQLSLIYHENVSDKNIKLRKEYYNKEKVKHNKKLSNINSRSNISRG